MRVSLGVGFSMDHPEIFPNFLFISGSFILLKRDADAYIHEDKKSKAPDIYIPWNQKKKNLGKCSNTLSL
jgi:hypothetical protein